MNEDTAVRFFDKTLVGDGCWEWQGGKFSQGYGAFKYERKLWKAHRWSYVYFNDEIPDGLQVCHSCDNPGCVNPKHLWLGTHKENHQDKTDKKRAPKGTRNGRSKLTDAQILEIRKDNRFQHVIARDYGVGQAQIHRIKSGKHWTEVSA